MNSIEYEIECSLTEAHDSGELRGCPLYGKPLPEDDDWDQTPEAFRMPFRILKNAGYCPPELELFKERARLQRDLSACVDPSSQQQIRAQLSTLEQVIALRLEGMRATGSL